MNCQEFWNTMPQQGGEITEEQAGHLAECSTCAAQWEPHRALEAGLRSMVEEWRRLEAPARVEAGLTAAFRSQAGFQVRSSVRHSWWTPVFAWASAAAAMVALAAFLAHGYRPSASKPDNVAAPHRITLSAPEVATVTDPDGDDESSALGDGFIRLPNAPRIGPNEDFNVVKMEVPGSTMIALGLSVSEDRASEMVPVDVALGSDGMALAVRFANDGGTL
jgi:hypothetical protein